MELTRKIGLIGVIQSLPNTHAQTGSDLYNDIIKRKIEGLPEERKILNQFFNVTTKEQFIDSLKYFVANAQAVSNGILIHLETHGSSNLDGLVLADGSLITWKELDDIFREINILTKNNLFISMANCYGRFLFNGADPYKKTPYQACISASKEVTENDIVESFGILFDKLIETGDLLSAYRLMESYESKFFYQDAEMLFEASINYHLNDPERLIKLEDWLKEFPGLKQRYSEKELTQELLDEIRKTVFRDIYKAQKAQFIF